METKPNRIFALLCIAGITLTGLTGCSESLDEDEALASCQVQVSKKLKDPSSASFDRGAESIVLTRENAYSVSGTGRATNSFGGTVPFSFNCSVSKDDSGDVWVTSSLGD